MVRIVSGVAFAMIDWLGANPLDKTSVGIDGGASGCSAEEAWTSNEREELTSAMPNALVLAAMNTESLDIFVLLPGILATSEPNCWVAFKAFLESSSTLKLSTLKGLGERQRTACNVVSQLAGVSIDAKRSFGVALRANFTKCSGWTGTLYCKSNCANPST